MRLQVQRFWLLLTVLTTVACENERARTQLPPDTLAVDATRPAVQQDEQLVRAAESVVSFLQGEAAFDSTLYADSVTLYLAPEAGGESRKVPRAQLRELGNWRVGDYPFAPPNGAARLTTRVGRHFNCQETSLATRSEELARLPHVGARLQPAGADSCLQVWNLTVVFAPGTEPPVLVAVLYDQFEW